MALQQMTFNIGAFNDDDAGGNNYITGEVYEVYNSNGTLADIFSDAAGSNPIPQDGISNVSNNRGECLFFIGDGDYYVSVQGVNREFKTNTPTESKDYLDVATLSEAVSDGESPVGSYVRVSDRGFGLFRRESGTLSNGFNIISTNRANIKLVLKTEGLFKPSQWGVDITGATNSDDAYDAVVSAANAEKEPLTCDGDIIKVSSSVFAPSYGFRGNHSLLGGVVLITGRRNYKQTSGAGVYDNMNIHNSTYNRFDYTQARFEAEGGPVDGGTVFVRGGTGGSYWNTWNGLLGNIEIEVGGDSLNTSVNQNVFENTRGHLHISGGFAGSSTPQECDQNFFNMIDTSGADLTDERDGSTGWHILNSSYLNQNNILQCVYMETSGKRAIKGNFHTLRTYSDGSSSPYATPETCHHLLNGDHNIRNTHDFLALTATNLAYGGLWDKLNCNDKGQPVCMGNSANLALASVVADSNIPMGFTHKFGGISEIEFSNLTVRLNKSVTGRYGLCLLIQVMHDNISLQINTSGSASTIGPDVYHDMGGNWRLYKLSMAARNDGQDDTFTIFFRGGVGNPSENYLAGVWATPFKTVLMPAAVHPNDISGVSTDGLIPHIPIALPVGGRINNVDTSISSPAVVQWIKTSPTSAEESVTI